LIKTIAREKEWEEHQAQNDAIRWGSLTPGGGWEVTPPASPAFQDGVRQFGAWGITAEQLASSGTWPTEEELYAERECLRLGGSDSHRGVRRGSFQRRGSDRRVHHL
jgi:hypothetical protein